MKPLLGICCLYSLVACTTTYPGETSQYESFAPDGIEIKVAETPWTADMHGNHRAIVQVSGDEAVAKASLKWRRPDLRPDTKKVVVTDAQGNEVQNVFVQTLNAEEGTILFEPTAGKGTYYIYYLPYKY
ncbi:MAG: glycoside hydrolase domain-containing protein, partial [Tannerellaceae bacterium]